MAIPPNEIGYQSQNVRPQIEEELAKIERQLSDPIYAKKNNKASNPSNGDLLFIFNREGHLNEAEIDFITYDWVNSGWTSVVCKNNDIQPNKGVDYYTWTLILTYTA